MNVLKNRLCQWGETGGRGLLLQLSLDLLEHEPIFADLLLLPAQLFLATEDRFLLILHSATSGPQSLELCLQQLTSVTPSRGKCLSLAEGTRLIGLMLLSQHATLLVERLLLLTQLRGLREQILASSGELC